MAGLLYKDFIGIKGKRILWILLGLTVVFMVLRFVFPGDEAFQVAGGFMRENEAGEIVAITVGDVRDSFLVLLPLLLVAFGIVLPSAWTVTICRNDEKNKTRQYTRVLPLEKNAYIASKYIFIGIAVYVLFSLENMWIIIFGSFAGNNQSRELINAFSQFLTMFSGISIILASFELPFFITLGVKKGMVMKTAILEMIAFLVIAYLFFGNLNIFDRFDILKLINWCKEHTVMVILLSVISPVVYGFIYFLSYRITCRINCNREVKAND